MHRPQICRPELPGKPLEVFLVRPRAAFAFVSARGSASPGAESAHEKDDQAYQQQQTKPAAADDGTAKVEPAAAEQEKQNYHE